MPPLSLTISQYASWPSTICVTSGAKMPDRSALRPILIVVSSTPTSVAMLAGSTLAVGSVPSASVPAGSVPSAAVVPAPVSAGSVAAGSVAADVSAGASVSVAASSSSSSPHAAAMRPKLTATAATCRHVRVMDSPCWFLCCGICCISS